MKKAILFFYSFLLFTASYAQAPLSKQWDKRYGGSVAEVIYCIQPTADGGCIMGGTSGSGITGDKTEAAKGGGDYWIVKLDAGGLKQWDKTIGSAGVDMLGSVQQTRDGGYIVMGYTSSDATGDKSDTSQGSYDYWVVRLDANGNMLWNKGFGGSSIDYGYVVRQTTDGGFIAGGYSSSPISGAKSEASRGAYDYWVVKIDSLGNRLWDKTYGSTVSDNFTDLKATKDGGFIVGGYTTGGIGGDKTLSSRGGTDFWIVKADAYGNKQWDNRYGGTSSDRLFSIDVAQDGGYILAGLTSSAVNGDKTQANKGGSDWWMVKIDSMGVKQWDKALGGTAAEDEFGNVVATADGGYLLAGNSYSDIGGDKSENNTLNNEQTWTIKTNAQGIVEWDRTLHTLGHEETGFGIQTTDGCYIFANNTLGGIGGDKTLLSRGGTDFWAIKFCDTSSVVVVPPVCNFSVSDSSLCAYDCITYTNLSSNATTYTWSFPGGLPSTSADKNPAVCYLTPGVYDATLIASNSGGADTVTISNYIDVKATPPTPVITQVDSFLYCSTDPGYTSYQWYDDTLLLVGKTDTVLVINHSGNYNIQVSNINDCKIAVGINIVLGLQNYMSDPSVSLSPNPVKDRFEVRGLKFDVKTVEIYNVLGSSVAVFVNRNSQTEFDVSALSKGVYFVQLKGERESVVKRMVKE